MAAVMSLPPHAAMHGVAAPTNALPQMHAESHWSLQLALVRALARHAWPHEESEERSGPVQLPPPPEVVVGTADEGSTEVGGADEGSAEVGGAEVGGAEVGGAEVGGVVEVGGGPLHIDF